MNILNNFTIDFENDNKICDEYLKICHFWFWIALLQKKKQSVRLNYATQNRRQNKVYSPFYPNSAL